ncbi:TonB-dependent receptor [Segatella bryantii]|uniref:TonB-dependent receptor n=1 Tax=Segatella bryantii TaxID=77095 RepID=UPI001EDB444E|nr:TonB-dependent receptor [Segatella bryantii]UKK75686.1 TonB-dependent receptor [Segatella bryantii]
MQNKVKIAVMALCYTPVALAQNTNNTEQKQAQSLDEQAFTFTEAQLGEDENMSQNVTILNSSTNLFASQAGYLFSPMRYRYRALNQKYNQVYANGAPLNDMESGQFRFSNVGGLNRFTRNVEFALPFESNNFGLNSLAGSNNYDFRAGSMQEGHFVSIAAANRNYTARGMYTYASGFNPRGWAFAGGVTYRWAKQGYVEGTFYNSLSYFFGVQKMWKNGHSLSFSTWGNPTERASQGASTDEMYWLANDNQYNPYWGYQNGHKRNSRVINDFAPSAILTWDWNIDNNTKLVTSLFGKYSMYKGTRLNYNNSENPQPDYWKALPSSYYDVWGGNNIGNDYNQWLSAYNFFTLSKANRQINWDKLYYANQSAAATGQDALYYVEAKHNDAFNMTLASTLTKHDTKHSVWNLGIIGQTNNDRHYKTMDDLLGATSFHNVNSYALGNYSALSDQYQYDLNTMGADRKGALVQEGDVFGYDYRIYNNKATLWSSYTSNVGRVQLMVSGKTSFQTMQRNGAMRNCMFADNSYGKSGVARFWEGGGKGRITYDAGKGHVLALGIGYEWNAPTANTAFAAPEMNNDFVNNLKDEHVFSSEFSYQYKGSWLQANINGYYNRLDHVTEWQNFYYDDINSFSYLSMTGIEKEYYGVELGLKVKLTSFLDLKGLGTISEAKYINNANGIYLNSIEGKYVTETVYNKGYRDNGTPLTMGSAGLSFHQNGWYIDLNANWYDAIYLSYAPNMLYGGTMSKMGYVDNDGNYIIPEQYRGHGGWMVDGSIGKSIRLKKGSLNFNLMVSNILNNTHLVTGGYVQSRSDYTINTTTNTTKARVYSFSKNPKKFYAWGTNGMFQISYRF